MPKCPKDCHKPNPLIFRRVIIPAALGDDKENPPQNGAYCNALVIYEANNAMYLYSSDGIPTKIPTALTSYNDLTDKPMINGVELIGDVSLEELGIEDLIDDSIAAEAAAREESDIELQDAIDAEEDARIAADEAIISQIPTVNDATLTLQRNNTNIGTFTANSSADTTINIDVPIYTSGLINDSGYITESALAGYATDQDVDDAVAAEAALRGDADQNLQEQIDAISSSSDVVDVVGTYAELQNYDTSKLGDNDIIKVLTDETHDDAISYYRWNDTTETFTYIGSQGPFYTKSETDATFVPQTRTVNGKALSSDIVLTASDVNALPASTVIPTVNNATLTIKKNGNNVASFTANSGTDVSADIIVPTKTSDITNDSGFITSAALPTKTSDLTNDGASGTSTYVESDDLATVATSGSYNDLSNKPDIMTGLTEMSYGESNAWAKFLAAYQAKQIVYCRASSNSNPATGSQTRKAFMAYVNNAENPTEVEFQYVRSVSSKTASQPVDQVFVYELTSANGGTWTVQTRDMAPKLAQGTNTTVSYSNGTYTISATQPTVPTKTSDLTNDGSDGTSTYVEADELATVATTGDYDDLTNKPTIPTVNNAVLTIQRNGANVDTFTANAAQDKTINIAVPTATSDLTNDSGFLTTIPTASANTLGGIKVGSGLSITDGVLSTTGGGVADAVEWANVLNRPTNVSYWTNDAGYITSAALPTKTSDLTNDGSDGTSTYVESDDLATVAASGSYNDLTNKPTIPTVNDATLTIQRNGTTVDTFTANASQNKSINIVVPTKTSDLTNDSNFATTSQIPTKTSDLTNDGSDGTSTYIETDDAQKFAIGQGSTNPVFDEMTPVKTIEWDVTDQTYRPIYQMANTGWTYINMDITVAYRITVTGTNIHSVTDIVDRWHNPVNYPITSMFCRTLGSSGATTGLRYLRAVYPMSAYLNNASYPLGTEIAMYNATARHVKIEVFKDNSQVTWNTTKPSGPIYVSGTYNNNNVMSAYDTRGWRFRQPAQMYASNAGYANYISDFEPVSVGVGELKTGATALAAGHYAFLADDGLVYDISNTAKNIAMCESKVGFMNSTVSANAAISYTYWRAISRPNATQVGYISHDTFALGDRVFLRCTMDSSGNVHSDNYLSTTMSAGYTWMPFGWARSATTLYVDTRFPMFYTLDANGKLTHINGKEVAGSGAASVAWGDITGTLSNQTDLNTALGAKANSADLATVATSGSYTDLTNKPTIPTVNNATLTIQKNSTNVATFTANAASNVTANITVPTKTSDLTNDSGFLDSVAWGDVTGKPTFATVATSGSYNDLSNKPTIPTAGTITSGSTGYATGGDVYNAIGDVESILTTLNNGGGAQ